MKRRFTTCLLAAALAACSPMMPRAGGGAHTSGPAATAVHVPAGDYRLDKPHASLIFRVNHLGFSHYTARFKRFDAKLRFDPRDLAAARVTAVVDARSIELNSPPPGFTDALRGKHWLDTHRFPEIRFRSAEVVPTGTDTMRITGELTLHGVTRPVVLQARYNGGYAGNPFDPHARVGFSAHGTFERSQFGMTYGLPPPGSTLGVGDDVQVIIEAEFSGPAWTPPAKK